MCNPPLILVYTKANSGIFHEDVVEVMCKVTPDNLCNSCMGGNLKHVLVHFSFTNYQKWIDHTPSVQISSEAMGSFLE